MKKLLKELVEIPEGISCEIESGKIICRKGGASLSRALPLRNINLEIQDSKILLISHQANKKEWKIIKSTIAHIKNMFIGLTTKYIYSLEVCNVHFPITLKLEKEVLSINNFLGEKVPRKAVILSDTDVEIKGAKIIVSSLNKESAGQTAANIEKATKIRARDRRIFQDGIFITKKPEKE